MSEFTPTPVPQHLHLQERHVVITEAWLLRLMACYFGQGPNHTGTIPLPASVGQGTPTSDRLEGDVASGPLSIQEISNLGGHFRPRGVAASKEALRNATYRPTIPLPNPQEDHTNAQDRP
jgi:hypothetical protein